MGLRAVFGLAALLIVGWLGATMGAFALTGQLPDLLQTLLADMPLGVEVTLSTSLLLFIAGAAVICLVMYGLSAVALGLTRFRRAV
jgi:hypothetical protein